MSRPLCDTLVRILNRLEVRILCGLVLLVGSTFVAGAQPVEWKQVLPSGRRGHAVAYDFVRGVMVMYGGVDRLAQCRETWEWNGTAWSLRQGVGPVSDHGHAMVFDTHRGKVVLFTGAAGTGGTSGETWEWDGDTWMRVPVQGPPPRYGHAMAFDSNRGVTVLFGGVGGGGGPYYSDTWEWNGVQWTQRTALGPSRRTEHSMCFDSSRGRVVLFGGRSGFFEVTDVSDETWEWDGAAWTLSAVIGPSRRSGHAMQYDIDRGRTVLFGGTDVSTQPDTNFADTWEWDGAAWVQVETVGPSPRNGAAMAYDLRRRTPVLVGGRNGNTFQSDLWEYRNGEWVQVASNVPGTRHKHAMVHDEDRGALVVFGGSEPNVSIVLGDTWEWDGQWWRLRSSTGPSARLGHAMAYDATRHVTTLFGGQTYNPSLSNQTWEWDGISWQQRLVSGPSSRQFHAMAHDTARSVTVMFGGATGPEEAGPLGETWEWDGNAWIRRDVPGPAPRFLHAMAYDPIRRVVVLVGGRNGVAANSISRETWEWDGLVWRLRSTTGPEKSEHTLAFDADRGRMVMYGGNQSSLEDPDEIWEWSDSIWSRRELIGPGRRTGAAMTGWGDQGSLMLFGGLVDSPEFFNVHPTSQLWAFRSFCNADLDDDGEYLTGGNRDGAVSIEDLVYFLTGFERGGVSVDIDDGSGTGLADGAVTIEDLLFFLLRFEAGC